MDKVKGRKKVSYKNLKIPDPIIEDVEYFMKENPEYRSRGEVVKEAIKLFLTYKAKGSVGGSPILADLIKRIEKLEKKKKDED